MPNIPGGIPILSPQGQPEQMASFVKTPDGKTIAMPYVTVGLFDQGALQMLIGALVPHIAEAVYQRMKAGDMPPENPPTEGETT